MEATRESIGSYEEVMIINVLLYLRSIELYAAWANQWLNDPVAHPIKEQAPSAEKIIETMKICGHCFEHLPDPPSGAKLVDQQFRNLGKEVTEIADVMDQFVKVDHAARQKCAARELTHRSVRLRTLIREALAGFEQAYPGRLTQILRSFQHTQLFDASFSSFSFTEENGSLSRYS